MSKRSRLNISQSLEELDLWWSGLDSSTKYWINGIARERVSGRSSDGTYDINKYIGKRKEFLKDLPKTVSKDWEMGRTLMTYVTHTEDMVIYTLTQEIVSDYDNPTLDRGRVIVDTKTVALFYTNVGKKKSRPYPIARRTSASDRLHGLCGTNPVLKHLVIEDRRNSVYYDNRCWCNKFLWSLGFPVVEKF